MEKQNKKIQTKIVIGSIALGARVTDRVSGFTGVVTAKVSYLYDKDSYRVCCDNKQANAKPVEDWLPIERLKVLD